MKKIGIFISLLWLIMGKVQAQNRANNIQIGGGYANFHENTVTQSIRKIMITYKRNLWKKYYAKLSFSQIGFGLIQAFPSPKDTSLLVGFIDSRYYKGIELNAGYNIIGSATRHRLGISAGYSYRWGGESHLLSFYYWGNDSHGNPVYEFFSNGYKVRHHGINIAVDYSFFLTRNQLLSIDNCVSTQFFWKGDPSLCVSTGLGVNF